MLRAVTFLLGLALVAGGLGWGLGWWIGVVTAGVGICAVAIGAERAATMPGSSK